MKPCFAALFLVGLLAATPNEDKKPEVNLEGTWAIKKMSNRGEEMPTLAVFEFTKDTMTMKMPGDEIKLGKYTINSNKKPLELDIVRQDGDQKGMTIKGIFSMDGDTLKICLAEAPAVDRPKEFKVMKGEKFVYMELLRKKK
jgi:uncharacterized protein (TIGR03067 family)